MKKTFRNLPTHVGVIMDGNGRWATNQNKSRTEGHKAGSLNIESLLDIAIEHGIKYVSLYAFSTENWKRPKLEVSYLFHLLRDFIQERLEPISQKGVKILHSGSRKKLPKFVLNSLDLATHTTAKNKRIVANFCINYGSQEEITNAIQSYINHATSLSSLQNKPIKPSDLEKYFYTSSLPPVDLVIRTAGECRLSNFLLWQSAYAELFFTNTLWPEFGQESFMEALAFFDSRKRKFGGL